MKWAKIPTEFLFKLSDREIAAVAKYIMLYGVLETVPTRSECLRVMSDKQLEIVQKHFKTVSKIISADIHVAQYDRDRKKQKKAEICTTEHKNPTESPMEGSTETTMDIPTARIYKNRSNTSPGGYVLPRASARATPMPTLDEVLIYAKRQTEMAGVGGFPCAPHTAEQFWAHYQSQGWRKSNDAATPVRDWKAALRMWCLSVGPGKSAAPPPVNNDDLPV